MSTSSNCDYFLLKGLFHFIGLNLNCLPYNTITKPFLFISSSFPPSSANKKPNILLVRAMVMQWSETSKMWESLFKHAYYPELYRCKVEYKQYLSNLFKFFQVLKQSHWSHATAKFNHTINLSTYKCKRLLTI